ncbi:MAG TPA: cbb3-type cytochrome c oxidase subunit I, partial [Terriglobales bacterium]|nr:cbb3-type cytochrome c oxidase subunit I [Terriglobales bacterium]
MSTVAQAAAEPREHYLNVNYGIKSWLLTTDHKRIGLLYLMAITFFFFIGGAFATVIRLELITPAGDLLTSDTYNKMFTMHGIIMVFFFLIPSVPAVLGNFLVPLMIGAKDLAFPKINLLSWYLLMAGGIVTLYSMIAGGVDTGWTFYTPFSTTFSNTHVIGAAVGILIAGFSSIFTGLNFIVTIHRMRAPGMTWFRLPLFLWSNYAAAIIMVLGTPVLAITLILVALERVFHIGIFNPALGGDPILFQHMFRFYSHPAVYIMVLPAMGVTSELISTFSRKKVFGYKFVAFASVAIAVFGFLVWAHHMFVAGISVYAAMIFSILSYLVAIPSAVKVFNWTATLYKGSISYRTPMLYAFGFIGLFTMGGLTGLFLAALGVDVHVTDTYFIVAHFHYIMVGGTVMGYLGGLHFWWPKMTGRMYPEGWAKLSALIIFLGFNLTFFPQFVLGYLGMPRRYHAYPPEFQVLNVLSSAGASILGVGYLLPLLYMAWSLKYGRPAGPNPWPSTGL